MDTKLCRQIGPRTVARLYVQIVRHLRAQRPSQLGHDMLVTESFSHSICTPRQKNPHHGPGPIGQMGSWPLRRQCSASHLWFLFMAAKPGPRSTHKAKRHGGGGSSEFVQWHPELRGLQNEPLGLRCQQHAIGHVLSYGVMEPRKHPCEVFCPCAVALRGEFGQWAWCDGNLAPCPSGCSCL